MNREAKETVGFNLWAPVLRAYDSKFRARAHRELGWFRSQPSLEKAVENAALARDDRGKRYRHQTRISRASLADGHRHLVDRLSAIRSIEDFDALLRLVGDVASAVHGLSELWTYDTALRIGAFLNVLPERIYLHAGTRIGASRLGFDPRAGAIEVSALPEPLRGCPPHEVEDILCIFKDRMPAGRMS